MAINESFLKLLTRARRMLLPTDRAVKAICLAYPDMLVKKEFLQNFYGKTDFKPSTRADAIREWHRLPQDYGTIYDTDDILAYLNIDHDVIDIVSVRGHERVVDLNVPLPPDLLNRYELLIDTGTLEHCFNVGQAFWNMCDLMAVGGVIVSMSPMTVVNHGFWNFNPTTLYDGFEQNGFKVVYLQGLKSHLGQNTYMDFLPNHMLRAYLPSEMVLLCVAQRVTAQPFKWPVQSKYKNLIPPS